LIAFPLPTFLIASTAPPFELPLGDCASDDARLCERGFVWRLLDEPLARELRLRDDALVARPLDDDARLDDEARLDDDARFGDELPPDERLFEADFVASAIFVLPLLPLLMMFAYPGRANSHRKREIRAP
jgi:hypothetical protein